MSLQEVLATQEAIQAEQKAIREEVFGLQRRIDATLKGDLQRLLSRLDATDDRINKIMGNGVGPSNGAAPPARAAVSRGIFAPPAASRPGTAPAASAPSLAAAVAARASLPARASPASPVAAPRLSTAGTAGAGVAAKPGLFARLRRKTEDELMQVKAALAGAVKSSANVQPWEEPAEQKVAPSSVDRVESQLKGALERCKEVQKYKYNPIQGLQLIFKQLDKNHSGKVDKAELAKLTSLIGFQADEKAVVALFTRYDVDNSGLLTVEEFGRSIFKLDGDAEFKAKSAIARMREVLSLRAGGFESIQAMGTQFRIIDRDRTGQLSKEEFNIALDILFSAYNCKFSQAERNSLFQLFDYDKGGAVSYDEFTRGIRGDMNDFRLDWVKQAFAILDADGSGVVDISDIAHNYDVSQNPAVMSGKATAEDSERMFLAKYDQNSDGKVTLEEFIDNYQWISASIDSDDYFELMMRNAWHITGGEGWSANTSDLRVLVKHNSAPDEVVEVKHDMGLPRDPDAKYKEVVRRLQQQGVKDIKKVEFFG